MTGTRKQFRTEVFERDSHTCTVPWCEEQTDLDAHHILERDLWDDGGYIPDNGATVCEWHHRYAESDDIPPQAFWRWIGISDPSTPETVDSFAVNKWGEQLTRPPWKEYRKLVKYPSTRHLPFSNIGDDDDTYLRETEHFHDIPLVVTHKMDGSNAMLVKDTENPVRARNGKQANHESFNRLKRLYWQNNLYERIPESLQVFGESLVRKHSIHYGCHCDDLCEDVGPSLSELVEDADVHEDRLYFQVFGIYDVEWDMWLSWPETEYVAMELGFPTVSTIFCESEDSPTFSNESEFYEVVYEYASTVVENGGEGIVVRTKFPFHYGQFGQRVGKYVRKDHVTTSKHWTQVEQPENQL